MTRVEDLMSKKVVSLEERHSVQQGRRLLREHAVGALPVLDENGKPHGIVTARDLAQDIEISTPIAQIMSRDVFAVKVGDEASKAAQIMSNQHIHHLLVMAHGEVAGILSAFDLLAAVKPSKP